MVTTKDIARECGVSLSTVQRALHGNGRISEETKNKILKKAEELNYHPDLVARTLVSGKSMTIGMVVPFLDNQYYPRLCNSVAEAVAKEGYILSIIIHQDDKELEKKIITMLQGNRVDGIILNPINKGNDLIELLNNIHVNCCVLGVDEVNGCPFPAIGNDEWAAGVEATKYIVGKGYEKLIFVVPTLYDDDGFYNFGHHKRLEGVKECLKSKDIELFVVNTKNYSEIVIDELKKSKGKKTAILCSGEVFALKVVYDLKDSGVVIGNDYGIMTFDYSQSLESINLNMTSLDNHIEILGEEVGKLMLKMCNGSEVAKRTLIDYGIVEGETL